MFLNRISSNGRTEFDNSSLFSTASNKQQQLQTSPGTDGTQWRLLVSHANLNRLQLLEDLLLLCELLRTGVEQPDGLRLAVTRRTPGGTDHACPDWSVEKKVLNYFDLSPL